MGAGLVINSGWFRLHALPSLGRVPTARCYLVLGVAAQDNLYCHGKGGASKARVKTCESAVCQTRGIVPDTVPASGKLASHIHFYI